MSKPKLIVITGPTATGKSALGVQLAIKIDGEIVSADSMQIYRHMDIGTAKPTKEEMQGVPHHMIDIISPWEDYSVARYVKDASKCVDDIFHRGKQPILVGGTGLYIDSLLNGRSFSSRGEVVIRQSIEEEYDNIGGSAMLDRLREIDPDSAAKLHENDKKRIVRALEVYYTDKKPISRHDIESKALPPRYDAVKIALTFLDRTTLYDKIDRRVDDMLLYGLMGEVMSLMDNNVSRGNTAMQAIGYKEIVDAILTEANTGETIDTSAVAEKIKMESRRYAKRQLTWLRRDNSVKWLNWDDTPDIAKGITEITKILN